MDSSDLRKKLFLGAVLVLGLGYAGNEYAYGPRAEEVRVLEDRLAAIQRRNVTARALSDRESQAELERRLALHRDQLTRVEGLVPSSEEVPDLLDAISHEAQRAGVDLTLIQPTGAVAEDYYTRRTYDLAVQGSYHQIGEFLTRIASLPRIVTPARLNVTMPRDGDPQARLPKLEAKFAIETYVLPTAPRTHVE
jgi:type IV pilus assembly protein PilO